MSDRATHWQGIYSEKDDSEVSWSENDPAPSLDLIAMAGRIESAVDIGAGASHLAEALITRGLPHVTALDLSSAGLDRARTRMARPERVEWIVADVLEWKPPQQYELWHDRAAFHFLTDPSERAAYRATMARALIPRGHAVIGTFAAPDGPERCSGLPVCRYDAAALMAELGPDFRLCQSLRHRHRTPWGTAQQFHYALVQRISA